MLKARAEWLTWLLAVCLPLFLVVRTTSAEIVAHYEFEDSGWADSSGSGYDLNNKWGAYEFVPGYNGQGLSLSGVPWCCVEYGDPVSEPNYLGLLSSDGCALEAWIKTVDDVEDGMIVSVYTYDGCQLSLASQTDVNYWGGNTTRGALLCQMDFDSGGATVQGTTVIDPNTWHHVRFSRDNISGLTELYLDDVVDASVLLKSGEAMSAGHEGLDTVIRIGASPWAPGTDLKGTIDDVKVHNSSLFLDVETDVNPHVVAYWTMDNTYNDSSGNGHVLNASWGNPTFAPGYKNECLQFTGISWSCIDHQADPATTAPNHFGLLTADGFTLEAWILGDASPPSGVIVSTYIHDGCELRLAGDADVSAYGAVKGTLVGQMNLETTGGGLLFGSTVVDPNEWHHIMFTRDHTSGLTQLWLDGALDAQTTTAVGEGLTIGADMPGNLTMARLGSHPWQTGWDFAGRIDEVVIYDTYFPGPPICTRELAGDISGPQGKADCYVNIYDLAMLADQWFECNDSIDPSCDPL